MRVLCPILVFPDQVGMWALPKRVMNLEIISGVPWIVLYFRFLKQKDNQHLCLFSFMHRSTIQSPSHPLLQVHPRMTTNLLFKEDCNGCLEKGASFTPDQEVILKKSWLCLWASTYSQHGTCWLCQQSPEKTTIANCIWASPVVILNWAICSSTLPCLLPSASLWQGQTFLWHNTKVPSAPYTEPEEKGARFD